MIRRPDADAHVGQIAGKIIHSSIK
jgi:hypothetical protein